MIVGARILLNFVIISFLTKKGGRVLLSLLPNNERETSPSSLLSTDPFSAETKSKNLFKNIENT